MAPADPPARHVQRLGDIAIGRTWLEVRCSRCTRHGRLRIARLLAEHGADAAGPDVLRALTADCPKLARSTSTTGATRSCRGSRGEGRNMHPVDTEYARRG
jgi:hypothetical protein